MKTLLLSMITLGLFSCGPNSPVQPYGPDDPGPSDYIPECGQDTACPLIKP